MQTNSAGHDEDRNDSPLAGEQVRELVHAHQEPLGPGGVVGVGRIGVGGREQHCAGLRRHAMLAGQAKITASTTRHAAAPRHACAGQ